MLGAAAGAFRSWSASSPAAATAGRPARTPLAGALSHGSPVGVNAQDVDPLRVPAPVLEAVLNEPASRIAGQGST